jgi:hypothetical protein
MHIYDFNILSPLEFEHLVADVITASVNAAGKTSLTVITQEGGPDKGVDFKLDDGKIIGQAKRYHDIHALRKSLKKEVQKVIDLNPSRYILIVSLPLSFALRKEIMEVFHPFLKTDTDIIDQIDLSRLLEEHREILLRYNKLWISSVHVLQQLLAEAVSKAMGEVKWNSTGKEIESIADVQSYFVPTVYYQEGIEILEQKNVLIITGDPGIGKTTLARALCNYFLHHKKVESVYCHQGIDPPLYIPNRTKRSIFFLDDFLGSNIWQQSGVNDISYFVRFIDDIFDGGHLLIMTTREYIYQQQKKFTPRLNALDDFKSVIALSGFSPVEKFDILLKNVNRAPLSLIAYESLKRNATSIIDSPGYNPKLIAEFIRTKHKDIESDYDWGYALYSFICSPNSYWESNFLELSAGSQLFLLCLFISNDPALHHSLLDTFRSVSRFRQISAPGFEADVFVKAVSELNNTFINVEQDTKTGEMAYSFSSTLIKDFLLHYLRSNDHNIEYLIKGAINSNQLFYAFTTHEQDRLETDLTETPLQGKKILLNYRLQELFIEKITTQFDRLTEIRIRKKNWDNGEVTFDRKNNKDNRVARLKKLIEYFDIGLHRNWRIKQFVLKQVEQFAIWKKDTDIYLHDDEFAEIPGLICLIYKEIKTPVKEVFDSFFYEIRSTSHFLNFYELRKIYKKEFDRYIVENRKNLIKTLEHVVYNDVTVHKGFWEQMGYTFSYYALNDLFDYIILDVFKKYNLTLTVAKWNAWVKIAGLTPRKMEKEKLMPFSHNRNSAQYSKIVITERLNAFLPAKLVTLSRPAIHEWIALNFPEQQYQLEALFASRKYLYKLAKFYYQLNPLITYCLKVQLDIPQQKEQFIIGFAEATLQDFSGPEKEAIKQFAVISEAKNWSYFTARQFVEFARRHPCEGSLFEKMIKYGRLAENNNWYCFVFKDLVSLFVAEHFKSSDAKINQYLSPSKPDGIRNFASVIPYLAAIDEADFLRYCIYPNISRFVLAVDSPVIEVLIKQYFEYYRTHLTCRTFRGKTHCSFVFNDNQKTSDLFTYCNISLSERILKNFPYESAYFKDEVNAKRCVALLKYMEMKLMDCYNFPMSWIKGKRFWQLLAKTDLAELIQEEVNELKSYLQNCRRSNGSAK